jgi:hypothetical protein
VVRYRISWQKQWISNGGIADAYAILANAPGGPTWFLVDAGVPGFQHGRPEDKQGLRTSNTAALFLEEVYVDACRRMGPAQGQGADAPSPSPGPPWRQTPCAGARPGPSHPSGNRSGTHPTSPIVVPRRRLPRGAAQTRAGAEPGRWVWRLRLHEDDVREDDAGEYYADELVGRLIECRHTREQRHRADAYFDRAEGEHRAVLVAGVQVLIERERFHDSYILLPDA